MGPWVRLVASDDTASDQIRAVPGTRAAGYAGGRVRGRAGTRAGGYTGGRYAGGRVRGRAGTRAGGTRAGGYAGGRYAGGRYTGGKNVIDRLLDKHVIDLLLDKNVIDRLLYKNVIDRLLDKKVIDRVLDKNVIRTTRQICYRYFWSQPRPPCAQTLHYIYLYIPIYATPPTFLHFCTIKIHFYMPKRENVKSV